MQEAGGKDVIGGGSDILPEVVLFNKASPLSWV